uniref:Clip domain-containing protein n=1 Tax=Riptortus pedestris TaxID=329032 RepID=R4WU35_RIPPE|nr:unknown secreted protein [Riptortus pedestris]
MNQKKNCLLLFCVLSLVQSDSTTEKITSDQIIMPDDEIQDKLQNNECTVLSGTQEIVGICVPIKRCEVLFKLLEQVERRPDIKTFLLR